MIAHLVNALMKQIILLQYTIVLDWQPNSYLLLYIYTSNVYSIFPRCDTPPMVISPIMTTTQENTTLDTSENIQQENIEISTFIMEEGKDITFSNSIPLPIPGTGARADIIAFLNRPIKVLTGTWATTDAFNTDLFDISIFTQFTTFAMWTSKHFGFKFVKYDTTMKTIFNPSPFHAGSVYVWWNPIPVSMRSNKLIALDTIHTADLICKSQKPGTLYTCGEDAIEITIPYVSPTLGIDKSDAATRWDSGSFVGTVAGALRTGTGANTVNWSIWMHFNNVELFGPWTVNGVVSKSKSSRKVIDSGNIVEQESPTGPISSVLDVGTSVFNSLSGIPFLSAFCQPAAWVTTALSGAASAVGWSKPDIQSAPNFIMKNYHHGSANASGYNMSDKLSVMGDNFLTVNPGISFRMEDEMSINFIKSQWSIFSRFNFLSTNVVGDVLHFSQLTPSNFQTNFTLPGVLTHNLIHFTPVAYLGSVFQYWRGGFEFKFVFLKTGYHAGSLSFIYNADNITPSSVDMAYLHKTVIDLQDGTELCVSVPYSSSDPWKNKDETSGRLYVEVVSPLRFPDTVSSTVEVLVYIRAAPDMEFAVPRVLQPRPIYVTNGVEVENTGTLACSSIGGTVQRTIQSSHAEFCIGEKIMSLSSLLKRGVPLYLDTSLTFSQSFSMQAYYAGINFATQVLGTYTIEQSSLVADFYSNFSYMYLLCRGSLRIRVCHPSVANGLTSAALTVPSVTGSFLPGVQTLNDTDSSPVGQLPAVLHQSTTEAGLSVQIPFYHKYMACQPSIDDGTYMPNYNITVRHNTDPTPTWVMRTVADDFHFSGFLGIPVMYINST